MQIELIGCTGAGKTSLAKTILQHHQQDDFSFISSYDFVLSWARLNWIKNHGGRVLALNLIALFACLLTGRKYLDFFRFVLGVILRLPAKVNLFERIKIARIAARNVGIYEIVQHNRLDRQVVLADEGTLHIAHYLFVHVSIEPNMADLETFVRLVPLPEVAVYIRQPESVLIARTRRRGHKRIPENGSVLVNRFIQHGLAVFEKLVQCSILESRLLIVNGGEITKTAGDYPDHPRLDFARKIIDIGIEPLSREAPNFI